MGLAVEESESEEIVIRIASAPSVRRPAMLAMDGSETPHHLLAWQPDVRVSSTLVGLAEVLRQNRPRARRSCRTWIAVQP
jgi:hypothetical protein